jgi:hypothetical protein
MVQLCECINNGRFYMVKNNGRFNNPIMKVLLHNILHKMTMNVY